MGFFDFLKNKIANLCGNSQRTSSNDLDFSKYYQKWDENFDKEIGYEYFKICTNPRQFPYYNSLGTKLANARKSTKLTQVEAAKVIGISSSTLSSYENDNTIPSDEKLNAMAQLYNVSFNFLKNGYAKDLATHIKCAKLCDEDEYLNSLCISTKAAKKMFPEILSEKDNEICKLVLSLMGIKE